MICATSMHRRRTVVRGMVCNLCMPSSWSSWCREVSIRRSSIPSSSSLRGYRRPTSRTCFWMRFSVRHLFSMLSCVGSSTYREWRCPSRRLVCWRRHMEYYSSTLMRSTRPYKWSAHSRLIRRISLTCRYFRCSSRRRASCWSRTHWSCWSRVTNNVVLVFVYSIPWCGNISTWTPSIRMVRVSSSSRRNRNISSSPCRRWGTPEAKLKHAYKTSSSLTCT